VGLDVVVDDGGEPLGERRGGLVAALLGIAGVPTDVGDHERTNAAGGLSHGLKICGGSIGGQWWPIVEYYAPHSFFHRFGYRPFRVRN
jgi:hypothetical protein